MIACQDIQRNPANPRQVSLINLINEIRSRGVPPFPLFYRELCVYVQLTECRGPGDVEIKIEHADSGQLAYPGPEHSWRAALPRNPLSVVALPFRIRNFIFPEAGLYLIQLWYNSKLIADQPLILR